MIDPPRCGRGNEGVEEGVRRGECLLSFWKNGGKKKRGGEPRPWCSDKCSRATAEQRDRDTMEGEEY